MPVSKERHAARSRRARVIASLASESELGSRVDEDVGTLATANCRIL
jgi:hypothetical protein